MINQKHILSFLTAILLIPLMAIAQVDFNKRPDDDLGNVADEFQEFFFEALKQKGIENYDRAIDALYKCLNLNSKLPVVYFELGKNYNKLKAFSAAEDHLKKAIAMQPDNAWFLDELYHVYYQQDDIYNAIETIKQLVKYHPDYKEDLATLYIREKKYKQAIDLLDELDINLGVSKSRDAMRHRIYSVTNNVNDSIENLEDRISKNPNNEDNHLKLIYRHIQTGNENEAYKAAKKLLRIQPDSKLAHLALYKLHLKDGNINAGFNAIKLVLKSPKIDTDSKTKVLKDIVAFVAKNPEYESNLIDIITVIDNNKNTQLYSELGQYYLRVGYKTKALSNFKAALKQNPNDFKLIQDILLLQIDVQDYNAALKESNIALELYPAQPILYLVNGIANNRLEQYKKAVDSLEMGLDFLIENPTMEIDFYTELSIAFKGINRINTSEAFAKKAQALKAQE